MDYTNKCYKETALYQVIIRLDYLEYIDSDKLFFDRVEKTVLQSFPIKAMPQIIRFQTMNVTIETDGSKTERATKSGIQQVFSNMMGNRLIISNKFLILEINRYISYEETLILFTSVLKAILEENQITVVRTGIRYINMYNDNTIRPLKKYFTSPVSALMDPSIVSKETCIRTLNLTEYEFDDMRLNFRYGQYNPQYPQKIKKSHFVLDFDCFCETSISGFDSIIEHINKGHDEIQHLFEDSITEALRKVMG